ncbi:MAG TPA: right-handed parallel beta-helix repeat-containing protein [Bacteroidales bacterium]|nr:right-handed parallel beta-helix repeat-containing protein [Bacteroidales bacterium]HNS47111.1 right-handed parallel beta-helix repeat-containing protein [Bacteroidales bacterium]
MKTICLLFCCALLSLPGIQAQIIHVPGDETTIQEGINAASDGDTVLVDTGTYYENINFNGKAITVASHFIFSGDTSDIVNTIIDGSQPEDPALGSVVTFESGEDTTSVLVGFTITGGTGTCFPYYQARVGGGILCYPAGAKIENNSIQYNSIQTDGTGFGAGISMDGDDWIVIRNNKIRHNTTEAFDGTSGGGLDIWGNAIICDNEISHNTSHSTGNSIACFGGGISCNGSYREIELEICRNTISFNKVLSESNYLDGGAGGGIAIYQDCSGKISGNIISDNEVSGLNNCYGPGVILEGTSNSLLFDGNYILRNTYSNGNCKGGGINFWLGTAMVVNNIICENSATMGGGIYINEESPDILQIISNTVVNNTASETGEGIHCNYTDTALVLNTIFCENEASFQPEIALYQGDLEVHYCDVMGGWEEGVGNINADPGFMDDHFHLDPNGSECINKGTDSFQMSGEWYYAPEVDYEQDPRPDTCSFISDIGADEVMYDCVGMEELQAASCKLQVAGFSESGLWKIRDQISVGNRQ